MATSLIVASAAVVGLTSGAWVSAAVPLAASSMASTQAMRTSDIGAPRALPSPPPLACDGKEMRRVRFFIVDTSEGIDLGARERIAAEIKQLVKPEQDSWTGIVLLHPNALSSYEPVQLASECLEPRASKLDEWLLLSRKEKEEMAGRLEKATVAVAEAAEKAMIMSQKGGAFSPLFETVVYVTKRPEFLGAVVREVYLYSDMRQHSTACTVYGHRTEPASLCLSKLWPSDMQGAPLYVLHLSRSEPIAGDVEVLPLWTYWVTSVHGQMTWRE